MASDRLQFDPIKQVIIINNIISVWSTKKYWETGCIHENNDKEWWLAVLEMDASDSLGNIPAGKWILFLSPEISHLPHFQCQLPNSSHNKIGNQKYLHDTFNLQESKVK